MELESLFGWKAECLGAASALAVVSFVTLWRWGNARSLPLPPGPAGWPLIGNILQIPLQQPWKVYKEWRNRYGDVIYLKVANQGIVVLNSLASANELLVARAPNYSDRPQSALIKLMNVGWAVVNLDYHDQEWKDNRRLLQRSFTHSQIQRFHPAMEKETQIFLCRLMDDPKSFPKATRYLFGTSIIRISYGAEDFTYNKELVEQAEVLVEAFAEASVPGRFLVGIFPSMQYVPKWFPGTGWRRVVEHIATLSARLRTTAFEDTQERLKSGVQSYHGNVAGELIEQLPDTTDPDYGYQLRLAKSVSAISYLAGSDTTVSSGLALFLALAMYPEVQRRGQAEVDTVVGTGCLPTVADLERLPYVQAIIKEVSRWHTVLPLGFPHVSHEDDVFNGYRIPAKTIVMVNTWAIMHDPEVFEEPMEFRPERYLKDGKINPSVLDPEAAAFGFGRRICPGRSLAIDTLTFMAASLLSCFDVSPSRDKNGNLIQLKLEADAKGFVATPEQFECEIVPRSSNHAALLNSL